jgi:hypothetical protein
MNTTPLSAYALLELLTDLGIRSALYVHGEEVQEFIISHGSWESV